MRETLTRSSMEVKPVRFGNFLFFIGFLLLIVFYATAQGPDPQLGLFFVGIILIIGGFVILWKNWRNPSRAERFRILKRMHRTPLEPQPSSEENKKRRDD
jgi:uncharacterized membrane protein